MSRAPRVTLAPRAPAPVGALVLLALTCVLFTLATAPPAHAAWIPDGTPVCSAAGDQDQPRIISDAAAGAYIAWMDAREPDTARVFVQRIAADGSVAAGWPVDGKAAFLTQQYQFDTEFNLASDGVGGVFVVANGVSGVGQGGLRLVRFQPGGALAPGWPTEGVLVADGSANADPAIASDGAGGCIVLWLRDPVPPASYETYTLHAQRFTAGGAPLWTANGIELSTVPGEFHAVGDGRIRAVSDGAAGAIVTWHRRGTLALHAQRVTSAGAVGAGWPADGIEVSPHRLETFQSMVADGAGGAFVTWTDDRNAPGGDVFALRLDGAGATVPGWTAGGTAVSTVTGDDEDFPSLLPDGAGGVIATWRHTPNGLGAEVRARRLDGAGATVWGPQTILDVGFSQSWSLAGSAGGDLVALAHDVLSQRVAGAGVSADGRRAMPLEGETVRSASLGGSVGAVGMVRAGAGAVMATWNESRAGTFDIYAMRIESRSNLDATLVLSGWDGPVVPRDLPLPGLVAVVTPTLEGNAPATYLNWSVAQAGPNTMPAWSNEVWLDTEDLAGSVPVAEGNLPYFAYVGLDEGPVTVRGGRHSLTVWADRADTVPETSEADNTWEDQWVWSPLPTDDAVPNVRSHPPFVGVQAQPNADGFEYARTPGYAWVVGLAPRNAGDDYDLYLYDDYAGSTSGFSNLLGTSTAGTNDTDFMVGHYFGTPTTVYPAAVRYLEDGGAGDLAVDQNDAEFHNGGETGYFAMQSLGANRLVDVYEAYLTAGTAYAFTLERLSGTSNIAFGIFDGTPGGIYSRFDALVSSAPVNAYFETGVFAPTVTGWHPVVVYRRHGNGADTPLDYTFKWGVESASAPAPGPAVALAFHGAAPNPASGRTTIAFDLPQAAGVRLAIYDAGGRRVRVIADARFQPGAHRVTWDGADAGGRRVAPGLYYARFETMGRTFTRRMVMLR